MADTNKNGQIDYDESSRLASSSEDFRTCSLAKNSPGGGDSQWSGYVKGNEYREGSNWTIANDGDGKGRDPKDGDQQNPNIGTKKDVAMRTSLMAKNTPTRADDGWTGYNSANQYCAGSDLV